MDSIFWAVQGLFEAASQIKNKYVKAFVYLFATALFFIGLYILGYITLEFFNII